MQFLGGRSCGTISIDVELPPFGQRRHATRDRIGLRQQGVQGADHLHAGRAVGELTMNDPIVDEVRRIRDAHAARFNYDLDAIFRDIKEQEKKSGHKFISGVARPALPNPPTGPAATISESSKIAEAAPAAER